MLNRYIDSKRARRPFSVKNGHPAQPGSMAGRPGHEKSVQSIPTTRLGPSIARSVLWLAMACHEGVPACPSVPYDTVEVWLRARVQPAHRTRITVHCPPVQFCGQSTGQSLEPSPIHGSMDAWMRTHGAPPLPAEAPRKIATHVTGRNCKQAPPLLPRLALRIVRGAGVAKEPPVAATWPCGCRLRATLPSPPCLTRPTCARSRHTV